VESFDGKKRDAFLNETLFRNLAHARELLSAWTTDYNNQRPHSALGDQTPAIARPAALLESPRAGRLLSPRRLA
jgi:putative transposase